MLRMRTFVEWATAISAVCLWLAIGTDAFAEEAECAGADSWYGEQVLNSDNFGCLAWKLVPGTALPAGEERAAALVGRRFSVQFEPDTWNTSDDAKWSYDSKAQIAELDIPGNLLQPSPSSLKSPADIAWAKVGAGAYGIHIWSGMPAAIVDWSKTQAENFPDIKLSDPYRAIYLAELGAGNDPGRLGRSPFYARFNIDAATAYQLRQHLVLQVEGAIVSPAQGSVLHCGQLAPGWHGDAFIPGRTQSCVFSVKFDRFALRLDSGKTISEWKRPAR